MHLKSHRKFLSVAAFLLTWFGLALSLMLVSASPTFALETVTTFESTCTTPKTVFQLGDTVCAKVDNVVGGDLGQIWLQWVAPDGTVAFGSAGTTVVTTDGQTFTQALPTTGANAQQGRWKARTANVTGGSVRGPLAVFRVPRMSVTGVRRDTPGSVFYFRNTNTTGIGDGTVPFGIPGDIGLVGDWDGDGVVTPGVYRPSDNTFYLSNSPVGANADVVFQFGPTSGNPRSPVVGDWDGDGVTTVGIHQDDVFYLRNSNSAGPADLAFVFGIAGDVPLAGDWDGDGVTTVGAYRTGAFFLRNSNSAGPADLQFGYGILGDVPITGDWDADGTTTIGVYRSNPGESAFYLKNSNDESNGGAADVVLGFGVPNDQPLVHVHNEAPVVTAGGTLPYTESDPATAIEPALTLTDMDSAILVGATATITGNCASGEDVLSFADQNGITGNYTGASCLMTLSGRASVANYRTALRSVKYSNTSTTPSTLSRTVTWQVNDGAVVNNLSAPVTSTITITAKASQTINFTSSPPGAAVVGGPTYTVTATGGGSGNPVTFTIDSSASSVCSIVGSTVSFTAVGTCVIDANQAGSATFETAPQVQQSFAVGQGTQTINFTSPPPGAAVVGGPTYMVTATGGGSGNPVTFTIDGSASTICSIVGSTVSFTAVGTCVIDANQTGNANYSAASQAQQSFAVGKGSQSITFTSTAPTDATVNGPTYTVTATGGVSGNAVTFAIDGTTSTMCSIVGSVVSFGPNGGTCLINANQLGNANYNAAPQAQQSFPVTKAPTITSANSYTAQIGTALSFNVTATGPPAPTISQAPTGGQTGFPGTVTFTPSPGSAAIGGSVTTGGAQTYTTTITANNGIAPNATQAFSLIITCPAITLGPANNSIFTATYNVLFSQAFTPSGGTAPYTYTLGGTALPSVGFSGNNLTGTPNNTGSFAFTVKATDTHGCDSPTQNYTLNVNPSVTNDNFTPVTPVIGNVFVDSSTVPFSVVTNDSFPAGTASISAFDTTGTLGGTLSMTTPGADVGKFTYDPPRGKTGTDVFNYTLSSNGRTASGTVSITVANKIWFIDSASSCSSSCDGRQSHPYKLLSDFTAANTGAVPAPQTGDSIFIYTGSGYLGPLTLRDSQKVLGEGASVSLATFTGLTVGAGQSLPTTGGTFPSITTSIAATNAVNVASGNTLRGFNVGNTTGSKISGTSIGTLTTTEITLSGSGQALDLTTGTLSGSLTGTTSSSGTNNVKLSGIATSGTYDLASGALSGAGGDALLISTGTGSFTYGGTIASGSAHSVNITGKTGGTVTLDGAITDNDTGISLTTNGGGSGATITFRGGMSISTSGNAAFTATGGGTVNVCDKTACSSGSAVVNTLTTTTGTALNVANTTIGASNLNFRSVNAGTGASGPTNGILLNSTGASGGLIVSGTGSAGTGGTIQKTTGSGISLTSVGGSASLTDMNITNTAGDGITAATVHNFSCTLCNITNPGTSANKDGLRLTELSGAATLTNVTVTGATTDGAFIQNSSATLTSLTITGGSFGSTNNAFASADSGIIVIAKGTGVITAAAISGVTFANNFSSAVQSFAQDTATIGDITVSGSTFTNNGAAAADFDAGTGTPSMKFHFLNNLSINGNVGPTVNVFSSATGTGGLIQGRIDGNHIGTAGSLNSGSTGGAGIRVFLQGVAGNITIVNNIIRETACSRGIDVQTLGPAPANGATRQSDIVITDNDVDNVATSCPFPLNDIYLTSDNQAGTATILRAEVHNNKIKSAGATPANTDFPFDNLEWLYFDETAGTAQLVKINAGSATANADIAATQTSGSAKANAGVALIAGPITTVP